MRFLALLVLLLTPGLTTAADPSALWKIVNGKCVPHEQAEHDPQPCISVDVASGVDTGYAILKDLVGVAQFLLIPTARLGGIEDPKLLDRDAPNYWDAAWQARRFTESRAGAPLPRDALSLAINSSVGRTQDQLHIHIDCVRTDVRDAVAAHLTDIGTGWALFPVPLAGHTYRAMRIEQTTLDGADPFRLLAASDPAMPAEMGRHTLVVIGARFGEQDGFVLLDNKADLLAGDRASGEQLQDHDCKLAH